MKLAERRVLIALAMATVLTLPVVGMIFPSAAGAEPVPASVAKRDTSNPDHSPEVLWENFRTTTLLYFTNADSDPGDANRMTTFPANPDSSTSAGMQQYAVTSGGEPLNENFDQIARFRSNKAHHAYNLTGDTALALAWFGNWDSSLTWLVRVYAREVKNDGSLGNRELIAEKSFEDDSEALDLIDPIRVVDTTVPLLRKYNSRYTVQKNYALETEIEAQADSLGGVLPSGAWTLRVRDGERPSRLEVTSPGIIQVAGWVTDRDSTVRGLFRHNATVDRINEIHAAFAVKSAFGDPDVRCTSDDAGSASNCDDGVGALFRDFKPNVTITKGDEIVILDPSKGNRTYLPFKLDERNSTSPDGMWVFRSSAPWDFTNNSAGDYTAEFEAGLRTEDARVSSSAPGQSATLRTEFSFLISNQGLAIRAYDDDDPATVAPLETLSHEIRPQGTTTYLLVVENLGSANDTIDLAVQQTSAVPATGWIVRLGGPDLQGDGSIRLRPGGKGFLTVTVQAPEGAAAGNVASFTLTATSRIDPGVKSDPRAFTATVGDRIRHAVGIVNLSESIDVEGAKDNKIRFYAWNRGTRSQNLTVKLEDQTTAGWEDITLLDSTGGRVDALVFNAVPPGDIATATLQVTPRIDATTSASHTTRINVTYAQDGGPGVDADVELVLKASHRFQVRFLDGIRGIADDIHYMEMSCWVFVPTFCDQPSFAGRSNNRNDSVAGAWFRVWVTNQGSASDKYKFDVTTEGQNNGEDRPSTLSDTRSSAFPPQDDLDFGAYYRKPDGRVEGIHGDGLPLAPGQTGEVYVWVGHQSDSAEYVPSTFRFSLIVEPQSDKNRAESYGLVARGNDNNDALDSSGESPRNGLKLEAVTRLKPYVEPEGKMVPLVDVSDMNVDFVHRDIARDTNTSLRLRVTNAASWASYGDQSSNVSLTLDTSYIRSKGWTVHMRPVNGTVDEKKNPWHNDRETLVVSNYNKELNRAEAYADQEIEIRVTPPASDSGHSVLAGQLLPFSVSGQVGTATHRLNFELQVTELANVTLKAPSLEEPIHPGGTAAFILNVRNNGSSTANVHMTTRVDDTSTAADLWTVQPQNEEFVITSGENLSKVIRVTAPDTIADGEAHINVSLTYAPNPDDPFTLVNRTVDLTALVRQPSSLKLTPAEAVASAAPEGSATFNFELRNDHQSRTIPFRVTSTPIPNWTASVAPSTGEISPGETETVTYTLILPDDVIQDRSFWSSLKVAEVGDDAAAQDNFATASVKVDIIRGKPLPVLDLADREGVIAHGATLAFSGSIKNLGTAPGTFPLETRVTEGSGLTAWVTDEVGDTITEIEVGPNELKDITFNVKAPATFPQTASNAALLATLTAFGSPTDSSIRADVTARIFLQEQGVDIEVTPTRADIIPGQGTEFNVKVTNLGNARDNLTLSADLSRMEGWRGEFSTSRLTLEAGASTNLRLVLRAPRDDLPSPRSYTFQAVAESESAKAAGLVKRDSESLTVTVPNFRPFDVDNDGRVELAVDANRRSGDGFERFIEIHTEGLETLFVDNFSGKGDGRYSFLLEVPEDRIYTGIANVYFDPDLLFTYTVRHTPDLTGDATPDYLLDTDNDGVIDSAWDTALRKLMRVSAIQVFGSTQSQYLVDTDGDGSPDKYFDPRENVVSRVTRESQFGASAYGIDTQGDGKPDKYYNQQTGEITNAPVGNLKDFLEGYWYFFALFAGMVIFALLVVGKRRRPPGPAETGGGEADEQDPGAG